MYSVFFKDCLPNGKLKGLSMHGNEAVTNLILILAMVFPHVSLE